MKKIIVVFLVLALACTGCKKTDSTDSAYNNDVFTKALQSQVTQINYWIGDTRHEIKNHTGIDEMYQLLASITLQKIDSNDKDGFFALEVVTDKRTYAVSLQSGNVGIDSQNYMTDDDIVDAIRNIALRY